MAMTVINDWADGADFSDPKKTGDHHHARTDAPIDTPHAIIDFAVGEETDTEGNHITEPYDIYYLMNSRGNTHWPWTDPPEKSGPSWDVEARDPESLDVVAVPAFEKHWGVHTYALFSELDGASARVRGMPDWIADIDHEPRGASQSPAGIAGFAHVGRYSFEDYPVSAAFAIEQQQTLAVGTGRNDVFPHESNRELYDSLLSLSEFAPEHLPLKICHNDPLSGGIVGDNLDRRWFSILMDPNDYDVSDQSGTRQAARDAMEDRQVLAHFRDSWDHDSENPPEPPMLTDAGVDGDTIFIESDADTVEWITANGQTAGTGENIEASEGDCYLRAELWNSDERALTLTQPWGVET